MIYDRIVKREPVDKGWSGDKKWRVEDENGRSYLLRVSPEERYERRQREFQRMQQIEALGIPMCRPVEFGRCQEGVYLLLSWVDGREAEEVIGGLSEAEQYSYGWDAGVFLRQIHTIPGPEDSESWSVRFNRKIDRKIAMYQDCPVKYPGGEAFLNYIAGHRYLLEGRPQCYQHGDYHIGNMMIDWTGRLVVIDFDRDDWGDPWEEFNRIVWCAQCAPKFAAGMVDGYFNGQVPGEFWALLALYICSNTLSSLPWAVDYGQRQVDIMLRQGAEILDWYDNMGTTVPRWYSL